MERVRSRVLEKETLTDEIPQTTVKSQLEDIV